jgi:hypothetical protein
MMQISSLSSSEEEKEWLVLSQMKTYNLIKFRKPIKVQVST